MKKSIITSYVLSLLLINSCACACTAFQLKSLDADEIYCRSIEYSDPLQSEILIVGRGEQYEGALGIDKGGLQWKTKFGFVGMNQRMNRKNILDGMNEKGLVAAALFLPGFTQYQERQEEKKDQTIAYWQLVTYILSTCSSIQEIKSILPSITVTNAAIPGYEDMFLPLHFYFCDNKGSVLIVEYVDGNCFQWNNSLGVLTNSPPFAWHIFNLSNYIHLSPANIPSLKLPGAEISNPSQGSGMLGLPGDYTSAYRFVKATFFSQWASPTKDALDTVSLGFHILNTFDIFDGIIRAESDRSKNKEQIPVEHSTDITQWSVVHDRSNLKTYVRSDENLSIEMVDLKKIDFAKVGIKTIDIHRPFLPKDITLNAKPIEIVDN